MPTPEDTTVMVDPPQGGETPPSTPTLEEVAAELERTRKALREANREAAERRKRLEELEAAERARAEAELSATQKAQAEAERARAEAEAARAEKEAALAAAGERLLRAYVLAAASDFNDPADAWLYIEREAISLDENGHPQGLEAAVQRVREAKPYLLKASPGKHPGTPRPGQSARPPVNPAPPKPIVHL